MAKILQKSSPTTNSADGALVIIGASTRAAAASALRAGLRPWCADLFADADLGRFATVKAVEDYPHGLIEAIRAAPPGPCMYTGALENHPHVVEAIGRERPLWGNDPATLRRARDPLLWSAILQRAGLDAPRVCQRPGEHPDWQRCRWLAKRRRGAGGAGIQPWVDDLLPAKDLYLQELIEGESCAAIHVAGHGKCQLVGVTLQLVGVAWLNAKPFQYAGSVGQWPTTESQRALVGEVGAVLARELGLQGVFGVDGIWREGQFWPVEINPRYTASVEVLEYALGRSALALHADAFGGVTQTKQRESGGRILGKAIVFADRTFEFPEKGPWQTSLQGSFDAWRLPEFADIPAAGTMIEAGQPVLSCFAAGESQEECIRQLRDRVGRLAFA